MSWQVLCLFAFFAANGLCSSYGKEMHPWISLVLHIYSLSHNALMLLGMPLLLYELQHDSPLRAQVQSELVRVVNILYGYGQVLLILACIYCARRLQSPIRGLFEQLQELERSPSAPQPHLRRLLRLKVALMAFQVLLQSLSWLAQFETSLTTYEFLGNSWRFSSTNMVNASYFLLFVLLWKICNCNLRLQAQLQQLLHLRVVPTEQLRRLQRQQQCLIHISGSFCHHFRHVLTWFLLHISFAGILCGYYLIRIQFGRTNPHLNWQTSIVIGVVVLHALLELYMLSCLAACMEQLGEATRCILWRSIDSSGGQSNTFERCVS